MSNKYLLTCHQCDLKLFTLNVFVYFTNALHGCKVINFNLVNGLQSYSQRSKHAPNEHFEVDFENSQRIVQKLSKF